MLRSHKLGGVRTGAHRHNVIVFARFVRQSDATAARCHPLVPQCTDNAVSGSLLDKWVQSAAECGACLASPLHCRECPWSAAPLCVYCHKCFGNRSVSVTMYFGIYVLTPSYCSACRCRLPLAAILASRIPVKPVRTPPRQASLCSTRFAAARCRLLHRVLLRPAAPRIACAKPYILVPLKCRACCCRAPSARPSNPAAICHSCQICRQSLIFWCRRSARPAAAQCTLPHGPSAPATILVSRRL